MPRPLRERLAFSTNAFKKTSLRTAIDAIADLGYAGVEIMADQPHFTPSDVTTEEVDAMQEQVEARGLAVSNVNAFTGFFAATERPTGDTYHPTWIEHDPAARAGRVAHTLSCLRLAAALGSKTVSLQPGGPTVGLGVGRDEAGRRFAEGVRAVLPTARELGVTLAVEPEPGLLLQTTDEYRQWKDEHFAAEERVKMNFDIGHAFCVGEDPAAVARQMASQYAHVHVEDIAANRVHQHLAPGEGAIDFPALFAALDEAGYDGWVTVELYPFQNDAAGAARRAMEFLGTILPA